MKKSLAILTAFILLLAMPRSSCAAITQTALVTDNFTRANAANLGVNWSALGVLGGGAICKITGNSAQSATAATRCFAIFSSSDFPNDQYSQITNSAHANASNFMGPCVRMMPSSALGSNASTANGYCVNGSPYNISSMTNGTFTALATGAVNQALNDIVLLTVQNTSTGPQLTLFVNGAQATQFTDTTNLYTSGYPGMTILPDATVTNEAISNFVGGVITTPPTVTNLAPGISPPTISSIPLNLGTLTATGQAVQFTVRAPSENYLGKLQIIATGGQISGPVWVLECSQDGGSTWFQLPAIAVPSFAPQLGDIPPTGAAVFYDTSGLSGAQFRFGLAVNSSTTVTGNIFVWAMAG